MPHPNGHMAPGIHPYIAPLVPNLQGPAATSMYVHGLFIYPVTHPCLTAPVHNLQGPHGRLQEDRGIGTPIVIQSSRPMRPQISDRIQRPGDAPTNDFYKN